MKPDTPFNIATAPQHNSRHWKQDTVTWGEILRWVDRPADKKDCGAYVLGVISETTLDHTTEPVKKDCTARHRRKDAITSRSAITLDVDHPAPGLPEQIEMILPYAALVHTTYSSSPDDLRYRIIMPTDRDMSPEEYFAVASVLMEQLGWEAFDPGSVEPERYMFRPAAQQPGWFQSWVIDGDPVPVAEVAAAFDPDLSRLPTPKPHQNKRDPFTLDGVVGAFNRVYEDFEDLIRAYDLPYAAAGDRRWQLVGATSQAGMGVVSDGLVYSHHVKDPAYGQTCSAFDLVRLHRFGDLDVDVPDKTPVNRRPSHRAMLDLAAVDPRVVAELVGVDFDQAMDGEASASDWKLGLRLHSRTGIILDAIDNWDLIRRHESVFQGLYFNEFTMSVETDRDLPWRPLDRGGVVFGGIDRAALCHYIEREYRLRPPRGLMDELVDTAAQQRFVNPVRDYLDGLTWDGTPRVEECLPGVRPTPFTRLVARKSMVAAVARIYEPGIKWDHTLVLFGKEGKGKSFWVDKMSRGHSASLGKLSDKDTLITMQRSWIMLADEGFSLRKADNDVMKEFLTRTVDVFRMPYDREAVAHKRHGVIWASTNDEVFLRRQEGNRRFLIVRCDDKVDFDSLTDEYIGQLWAEAVHLYRAGERLFLNDEEGQEAAAEREQFTEEDALAGVVEEFLSTPVPEGWDSMSIEARQLWRSNRDDGFSPVGTQRIDRTCSTQIWVEALGRRIGDHRRADLLDINTVLKSLPDWEVLPGRHRLPNYGPQVVFQRKSEGLL